jgi:hypothetical protein
MSAAEDLYAAYQASLFLPKKGGIDVNRENATLKGILSPILIVGTIKRFLLDPVIT